MRREDGSLHCPSTGPPFGAYGLDGPSFAGEVARQPNAGPRHAPCSAYPPEPDNVTTASTPAGYAAIVVGTGFASSFFLLEYLRHAGPHARVLVLERGGRTDPATSLKRRSNFDL